MSVNKSNLFGQGYSSVAAFWLAMVAIFLVAAVGFVRAHSPHDHIEAFELASSVENPDSFVMLIVVRGNLWRSTDAGATWKRIIRGLDNRHEIRTIGAFGPHWFLKTKNGQIFRSADEGLSWERASDTEKIPDSPETVEFAPAAKALADRRITSILQTSSEEFYVVTWEDGVFVSKDSGKSWEQRADGLTTDPQGDRRGLPQFTTLRRAPDGTLFLAGYDGLFRSRDDGLSWEELETLPESLLIDFDVSPAFGDDREVVAITYWKGILRSRDGGASWQPITGNLAPSWWDHVRGKLKGDDEFAHIARFHSITYSPDYAIDGTIFAGLRNRFLISPNRGDSWQEIELTQFASGEDVIPDRLVFSDRFAEDRTLIFCSRLGEGKTRRGGVFKSTDGGRTFSLVHEAPGKYLQTLAVSPVFSQDGTVFVSSARGGNNSEIFRSRDGGKTWEIVTGGVQFVDYGAELAISPGFSNDGTIWAGTELGLWRSSDAGDNWTRIETDAFSQGGFIDLVALSPEFVTDRRMIVTVKGEGMFQSVDGGKTFASFEPELFEANHQFNRLWSYSPGALVKFAPGESELFAMTGESLFRLSGGQSHNLPVRQVAKELGEVNLATFWAAVAGGVPGIAFLALLLLKRRNRSRAGDARPKNSTA